MNDDLHTNNALRELLKGRTLYLMGREHVNDQKKPLAEIRYGMVLNDMVLFALKDTEATVPVPATLTDEDIEAMVTLFITGFHDNRSEDMDYRKDVRNGVLAALRIHKP